MIAGILFIAFLVCAYLAYDGWHIAVSPKDAPYHLTAEAQGTKLEGVPLHEQQQRKHWHAGYGMGEGSDASGCGVSWQWSACLLGAAREFFACQKPRA